MYEPPVELLPVFSQTKINDCYQDITYPSSFNWDTLLTPEEEQQLLPWKERKEVMFFRGSNTGLSNSLVQHLVPLSQAKS